MAVIYGKSFGSHLSASEVSTELRFVRKSAAQTCELEANDGRTVDKSSQTEGDHARR